MTTRISVDYVTGEPCPYEVSVTGGTECERWQKCYATLRDAIKAAKRYARERAAGKCEVWVFDGTIYDKNGKRHVPSNY